MPYLGKSPSQGVRTRFQFTPNAGTTSISGADANGLTLSFTDGNYVDVYLNGVMLKAGVDYNTNTANTIAGLSATVASDVVDIVVYDTFSVFGGTLEGNVKVNNGTFNVTGAVDFDSTLNVDGVVTTDGATHNGDVTFTGANYNAVWDKSDNALEFGDNAKAIFGAGGDLQIYHDGNHSYISDQGTGNLLIQGSGVVVIEDPDGNNMIYAEDGGEVILYHNASNKLETTSTGVTVTGKATINGGTENEPVKVVSTDAGSYIAFEDDDTTGSTRLGAIDNDFKIDVNSAERVRINSSGNVGIGTSSPIADLSIVDSSTGTGIEIQPEIATGENRITNYDRVESAYKKFRLDASEHNFYISGSNKVTINSSGNLLVGTTESTAYNNSSDVYGFNVYANGQIASSVNAAQAAYFNRQNSDGTIVDLRKDGSTVGSIGANGSRPYVAGPSKGIKFGNNSADPCTNSGGTADNSYDLGGSSIRWKDLYLSGGVYVGGTGSANHLDDYEEGTFTPVYEATGTAFSSIAYANQTGHYTKIGNKVTINLLLRTSSITLGSASGNVIVSGLPFGAAGGTSLGAVGSIAAQDAWLNFFPLSGWINSADDITLVNNTGDRTSYRQVPVANMATGSNKNRMYLTATYITS